MTFCRGHVLHSTAKMKLPKCKRRKVCRMKWWRARRGRRAGGRRGYPPKKSGMSAATLAVTPGMPFTSGSGASPGTTAHQRHGRSGCRSDPARPVVAIVLSRYRLSPSTVIVVLSFSSGHCGRSFRAPASHGRPWEPRRANSK